MNICTLQKEVDKYYGKDYEDLGDYFYGWLDGATMVIIGVSNPERIERIITKDFIYRVEKVKNNGAFTRLTVKPTVNRKEK